MLSKPAQNIVLDEEFLDPQYFSALLYRSIGALSHKVYPALVVKNEIGDGEDK